MGNNVSVVDSFARGVSHETATPFIVGAERSCARTGMDAAFAAATTAQLPPHRVAGRGSVQLLQILADPAVIRIACLAVGISALFLAIAASL
jgi:hypothetical protein